jgi:hypothetical protein
MTGCQLLHGGDFFLLPLEGFFFLLNTNFLGPRHKNWPGLAVALPLFSPSLLSLSMTDVLLAQLASAQTAMLQLEGLTRFQWLEHLLTPVVCQPHIVQHMCQIARQQVKPDGSGLEFLQKELVALLPADNIQQAELVSRIVYSASQACTKRRHESTVAFLAYLDKDVDSLAMGGESTCATLLPLFKWIQFSFSANGIESGVCEGVDLRTAGGGLIKTELELIGKHYEERGAIVWFYSLVPVLQRAICDVWLHQRNATF